jgi:uncharacterized protein YjeT (DUF2065 family)
MSESLWLALGLMLIFEGIGPLLFPNRWSGYMKMMIKEGPASLRRIGGVLCVVGLIVVFNFL